MTFLLQDHESHRFGGEKEIRMTTIIRILTAALLLFITAAFLSSSSMAKPKNRCGTPGVDPETCSCFSADDCTLFGGGPSRCCASLLNICVGVPECDSYSELERSFERMFGVSKPDRFESLNFSGPKAARR